MSKPRILSWKPNWSRRAAGGRWYRHIQGAARYFGYGKSPQDTKSYREAERKYLRFMEGLESRRPEEVAVLDLTVTDACEKYLQNLEERHQRGEITPMHVDKSRLALKDFAAKAGGGKRLACLGEMDIEDYRSQTLALPPSARTGRRITAQTAKGRLTIGRSFIRWAYKMYLLERMPRNLDDLVRMPRQAPTVRRFTVDELKTLWQAANDRLRCWMALALNCGFGQTDIAELTVNEVDWENGYVERERHKTGVKAKHKLWPLTLKIMKEQRNPKAGAEDRVFISEDGMPLVWRALVEGELKKSDSIKCLFWRAQVKTGINDGRCFYALRKTGASIIEQIDPAVTEMYLSHAERGMKRNYAERDWGRLERALGELERQLKDVLSEMQGQVGE